MVESGSVRQVGTVLAVLSAGSMAVFNPIQEQRRDATSATTQVAAASRLLSSNSTAPTGEALSQNLRKASLSSSTAKSSCSACSGGYTLRGQSAA
jgi:Flp pilus assembly protein TadG